MGSLWILISVLLLLYFVKPLSKRGARVERDAAEQDTDGGALRALGRLWRGTNSAVAQAGFAISLIVSLGFTIFLFAAEGSDVETGVVASALAYCIAILAYRSWRPPKTVPGGWMANVRDELRLLAKLHLVLAPLAVLAMVKIVTHAAAIDVLSIARDIGIIFAGFYIAWIARYAPLPDHDFMQRDESGPGRR